MTYCSACGQPVDPQLSFCTSCGTPQARSAPAATPAPTGQARRSMPTRRRGSRRPSSSLLQQPSA
ncbi:zinc ribbon domain-containing protein, partial [Nocardioides alcanivorans]|uniref:zinc ribbon domain-containing protein n=1 Tax=Nocardioides alcanivorans TaxID=2897352 RepID=UPI0035DA5FDC